MTYQVDENGKILTAYAVDGEPRYTVPGIVPASTEAADWAAIEAWQRVHPEILRVYWAHSAALGWVVEIGSDNYATPRKFTSHAPNRTEALSAAATWCRKELDE